jgi:hypothetical protein
VSATSAWLMAQPDTVIVGTLPGGVAEVTELEALEADPLAGVEALAAAAPPPLEDAPLPPLEDALPLPLLEEAPLPLLEEAPLPDEDPTVPLIEVIVAVSGTTRPSS